MAPPRTLGALRQQLSTNVKKLVAHEVSKDLAHQDPAALRRTLEEFLPTAVVAQP